MKPHAALHGVAAACLLMLAGGAAHATEAAPAVAALPTEATTATPLASPLIGLPPASPPPPADASPLPGRLDLHLRFYAEHLRIHDGPRRHGTIQAGRLVYQSDHYGSADGRYGLGVDLGLYGALKLDSGGGSRNMAHYREDGTGSHDDAWGYLGEYALKAKAGGTTAKYGLHMVPNPFLQPYDIRALPPTFRGLSVQSTDIAGLTLAAGRFDGVIPRGDERVRGLSTSYGGVPFERITYAGASAQFDGAALAAWASQSRDLWNQVYLSANKKLSFDGDVQLIGQFDSYLTRDTGARIAGRVRTDAFAGSLTAKKGFSALTLGYQLIDGDEFMDYTNETAGIYLGNAMGVDFNAPHEKSVQLRYTFDGSKAGIPGWTLMVWTVRGWGADSTAAATAHSNPADPLYSLYWKNGAPASGGHQEWAIKSIYTVPDGRFKGLRIAAYLYRQRVDPQYPSRTFNDRQLMINYPLRLF